MDDAKFLRYCLSMTQTERCGFVPSNIARLLRLAGREEAAKEWDTYPHGIVSGCHSEIAQLVDEAHALREMSDEPDKDQKQ